MHLEEEPGFITFDDPEEYRMWLVKRKLKIVNKLSKETIMHIKEWVRAWYFEESGKKIYKNDQIMDYLCYKDILAFYMNYEKEIWDFLYEDGQANNLTPLETIFRFSNEEYVVNNMDELKYALGCYAIQRVYKQILIENSQK